MLMKRLSLGPGFDRAIKHKHKSGGKTRSDSSLLRSYKVSSHPSERWQICHGDFTALFFPNVSVYWDSVLSHARMNCAGPDGAICQRLCSVHQPENLLSKLNHLTWDFNKKWHNLLRILFWSHFIQILKEPVNCYFENDGNCTKMLKYDVCTHKCVFKSVFW